MNAWIKKLTALILIALLVVGSVNLTVDPEGQTDGGLAFSMTEASAKGKKVAPKKVTIEGSKYVAKGKKIKLKATVLPEGANQKVTWSSSNPAVAKVDSKGNVKGLKAGKVKITAASKDNPKKKKTFALQVMEQAVKKVTISGAAETMTVGTTLQLTATQEPKKAAKSFTWSTSDANVATVSAKGLVTAVNAGLVTITAAATDGSKKKASVTIQVIGIPDPTEVPTAAPTETPAPTAAPTATPTPEPTATPTVDPKTVSQNFTVGGATYHYDGESQKVSLSTIDDTPASGGFIVPAEVPVPGLGTITVSAVAKGALAGKKLNYIAVEGANTVVEDSTGATYVFAPSAGQVSGSAIVIPNDEKAEQGGFLYQVSDTGATLLCPEDSSQVLTQVNVPVTVAGKTVTAIGEHALDGTSGVTSMSVPDTVTTVPKAVTDQLEGGTVETRVLVNEINITLSGDGAIPTEIFAGQSFTLQAEAKGKEGKNPANSEIGWSSSNTEAATVDQDGLVTAVAYSEQPVVITATAADGSGTKAEAIVQVWNIPEKIEITNTEKTMNVGKTLTMNAKLSPETGIKQEAYPVTWSVSTQLEGIATIDENGVLTASAVGEVTVKASVKVNEADVYDTKTITIYAETTSVTLEGKATMTVGEKQQLSWTISPDGADQNVSFSCDPAGIVTVSENGEVEATGAGTTTVTITSGGKTATKEITVYAVTTSVALEGNATMTIGETQQLSWTISPDGADQNVSFSCNPENIVTVSDAGLVEATGAGTTTVTITSGGKTATKTITVYAVTTSVTLDGKATMTVGETQQLSWTILPDGADQSVSFSCDPAGIVTVSDNGVVEATEAGTTTVTITSGGKTATLSVTVLPKATALSVSGETTIYTDTDIGSISTTLSAAVVPEGAQLPAEIVWSSGNTDFATVEADINDKTKCVVTAVAPGTVTITATAGEISGSITITVSDKKYVIDNSGNVTVYKNIQNGVAIIPDTLDGITVTSLAAELFKGNTTLTELTIPAGVTAIPASLCEGCTALTKVIMPNGITVIGQKAFSGCTSLSTSQTYGE